MMKIAFFANLGMRDLKFQGELLGKTKTFREDTKELLNHLDTPLIDYADLSLPILEPLLQHLLTRHEQIQTIQLFYTDQEDPNFRKNDTLYEAKIVQKVLNKKFENRILAVEKTRIPERPNDYDTMYEIYNKKIADFSTDYTLIYVSITGGTPAENVALLLRTLERYRERLQIIYASEDRQIKDPEIGKIIHRKMLKEQVISLLDSYDYSAVERIVRENNLLPLVAAVVVECAKYRYHFNFLQAKECLSELNAGFLGYERSFVEPLKQGLTELVSRELPVLLQELYFNIEIKWRTQQYADFLARLFRFHEASLQYVIETHENLDIPWEDRVETKKIFEEYIQANENRGIRDILGEDTIKCMDFVNRHILNRWIGFLAKKKQFNKETKHLLDKISKLVDTFRHRSIVAHGFEGISGEEIEHKYNGDILADLQKVMALLKIDQGENPFDKINNYLKSCIRQAP